MNLLSCPGYIFNPREKSLHRSKQTAAQQKATNIFLLINKTTSMLSEALIIDFLWALLSLHFFFDASYLITRLRSSQLLAEQWKIKLKWALNWLWLVSSFFIPFLAACLDNGNKKAKVFGEFSAGADFGGTSNASSLVESSDNRRPFFLRRFLHGNIF